MAAPIIKVITGYGIKSASPAMPPKNLFLLSLIVYRMRYDDWESNSCRIIQLYHVFLSIAGDILVIFCIFLYSTRLIQKNYKKNCSNIHRYFIKTHGITDNYCIIHLSYNKGYFKIRSKICIAPRTLNICVITDCNYYVIRFLYKFRMALTKNISRK